MKKVLSICLVAATLVVVCASCHKDCVCKKTYSTAGSDTTIVREYETRNEYNKKECESLSMVDSTTSHAISFECTYGK